MILLQLSADVARRVLEDLLDRPKHPERQVAIDQLRLALSVALPPADPREVDEAQRILGIRGPLEDV